MLFDIRTLYLLLCIGNFILFIMLVVFAQTTRVDRLFQRYTYGKLLQGIGISLALMRSVVPDWLSIVTANSFLFVGVALETFCLVYVGKKPSYRSAKWCVRLTAGVIVGFVALYLGNVSVGERVFYAACVISLASMAVTASLIFYNNKTKLRRVSGGFFFVFAVTNSARAVDALVHKATFTLYSMTLSQTVSYLMAYIYMLISTIAFLLMSREAIDLKLQQAAARDFLTGIYNRGHFMHVAQTTMRATISNKEPVSVLMIDLDHFKSINDKYGHFKGDDVLVHFAQFAASPLRPCDTFGRYGGEEFIVLLPDTGSQQARMIAQSIRRAIACNMHIDIPKYTVSIGAATIMPRRLTDIDSLMKMADEALFKAKRNGRDQIVCCVGE